MIRKVLIRTIAAIFMASGLWKIGVSLLPFFVPSESNSVNWFLLISGILFFLGWRQPFQAERVWEKAHTCIIVTSSNIVNFKFELTFGSRWFFIRYRLFRKTTSSVRKLFSLYPGCVSWVIDTPWDFSVFVE